MTARLFIFICDRKDPNSSDLIRYIYDVSLPCTFIFRCAQTKYSNQGLFPPQEVLLGQKVSLMVFIYWQTWSPITDAISVKKWIKVNVLSLSAATGILGSCLAWINNTPQYCEYYHGSRALAGKLDDTCTILTVSQNHEHQNIIKIKKRKKSSKSNRSQLTLEEDVHVT